jgi:two-component system response regulator YesN
MYKLLIVEDEATIREGLIDMIDWEKYGIEICSTSKDGLEGYQSFMYHKPDILLTDINMPQMDGIELIKKAKESAIDFEAILLSGFNEFNYAKEGIKLGALEYLLKPCLPDEILKTVLKAKSKLDERNQMKETMVQLKESWNKHAPAMKWQKLLQWMKNEDEKKEEREIDSMELGIFLKNGPVQTGIIFLHQPPNTENQQTFELVMDWAHHALADFYQPNSIEIFRHQQDLIWCANVNPNKKEPFLHKRLANLLIKIEHKLGMSACIGIGRTYPSIYSLHSSFAEAQQSIDDHFYKQEHGIFPYKDVIVAEKKDQTKIIGISEKEEQILNYLEQNEFDEAQQELDAWMILLNKTNSRKNIHLLATFFLLELDRLLVRKTIKANPWNENLMKDIELISNSTIFAEVDEIIRKNFQRMMEAIKAHEPIHKTIRAAVEIIHARYNQNLTLETLAKEVFVSTTYLSSLFKQELGINFLDFLHKYRINKAKQLLKQDFKVYAVAKMVGYQDERHFSSTFKKWIGLTPSEYQRKM